MSLQITVLQKGDLVPDGYEVVTQPLISEIQPDGAIVPHRQVAFRRAPDDSFVFSHGHAMIDDICIVNLTEEEVAPDEYRTVDELIGGSARGAVGDKMILSYHHRPALGICNIPLESSTLDRYPKEVHLCIYDVLQTYIYANNDLLVLRIMMAWSCRWRNYLSLCTLTT